LNLQDQLNDFTASLVFDPEEVEAEGQAAIDAQKKTLERLEEDRARYNNQIREIDNQGAQKRKEDRDKEVEEERKRAQIIADAYRTADQNRVEERNEVLDEIERIEEEAVNAQLSEQERALRAIDDFYFGVIERARAAGISTEEIERIQNEKRAQVNDEYRKAEEAKDEEDAAREIELQKKVQLQRVQLAGDALGAISALTEAFAGNSERSAKRAFQINKAVSIAQATISTFLAANAALTAGGNPAKLATGAQFVEAGVAVAIGLANVAKIARTKFGDTGGGGGARPSVSGGGGGSASGGAPNTGFATFGVQDINNRPNQAPRAYVLASDVTTQTEAAEKINDRAKL
jgi:hypothetical protein